MKSILDVRVSCFAHYRESRNPKLVNMLSWLTSDKYKTKVDEIRIIEDKARRDEIKATLPAITPSGQFLQRKESSIIQHSGLIQIDLDRQDNLHICNWGELKTELIKLPEIAYLGSSVSGTGYWGLIPIPPDTSKHKLYFDSIHEAFQGWGLELDKKPKNVASLRGYSFDEEGYFNHKANIFSREKQIITRKVRTMVQVEPTRLMSWLIDKMNSAIPGDRHSTRLKIGRLLGGYIGSGILSSDSGYLLIQNYLDNYGSSDSTVAQRKEIQAIENGIAYGMRFPITI